MIALGIRAGERPRATEWLGLVGAAGGVCLTPGLPLIQDAVVLEHQRIAETGPEEDAAIVAFHPMHNPPVHSAGLRSVAAFGGIEDPFLPARGGVESENVVRGGRPV